MKHEFLRQKNNKCTVEGCLPAEVWKLIYKHCWPVSGLIRKGPLEVVRNLAVTPQRWCNMQMWTIDKNNGKIKCKGKRPVCGVCPFGRAYMRARLIKKRPRVRQHAYGGIAGKRREEAIAISRNCRSRAARARKSNIQVFRDAAGAFNSVKHSAIIRSLMKYMSLAETRLFASAHKDAHLTLVGHTTWRIRKGTLPGHSIGGKLFVSVYGDALDVYEEKGKRGGNHGV